MPKRRSFILVPALPRDPTGKFPVSEQPAAKIYITERQLEILKWVAVGKSARDIGDILGVSHRTVEHQLAKVYENLEVRTRLQAVLKIRDLGVLTSL